MIRPGAPTALAAYLPRWTAQVRTEAGPRDPLGLSGHAHELTDELLPGITVQTFWARYYSIFCWILWHIGEHERPTSELENNAAFMRREAAFALATSLRGGRFHGIDNTSERLADQQDPVELEFRVLSHRYGAYGAHYRGSMFALGLCHWPTPIRDEPTPGVAVALAHAVDRTLRDTPFHARRLWSRPRVARAELGASAPWLSLTAIEGPVCAEERRLLIDLMFGFDCPGRRGHRPQTLGLLLWIVEQYERAGLGVPAEGDKETHLLYAPLYYGVLGGAADPKVARPAVPAALAVCAGLWQRFCAHQYWTVVQEWLFTDLLATLRAHRDGLTLREVADEWLAGGLVDGLERRTGIAAKHPAALVDAAPDPARYAFGGPSSESALCADADRPEAAIVGLWALHSRWFTSGRPVTPLAADDPRRSVARIVERWCDPDLTWPQAIAELLERHIVQPHWQFIDRKRLPASPWLGQTGNRYLHHQDAGWGFRNARINPAVRILRDLGLVAQRPQAATLTITGEGRTILARLLEPSA